MKTFFLIFLFCLLSVSAFGQGVAIRSLSGQGTNLTLKGSGALKALIVDTNKLVVSTNGTVGIGTNAPAWNLHVNGIQQIDGIGLRVPLGGSSAPSIASSANTNLGIFFGGSSINFSILNSITHQAVAGNFRLLSDTATYTAGASSDTFWTRVSPGVTAWGHSTAATASTNWVRGSYTNDSNQRGIQVVGRDAALNAAVVRSVSVGSDTRPDPLIMGVNAKQNLTLNTNGTASIRDGVILLAEGVVATVSGVDLNVTTKSTLFTVPTGITFIPTKIVVRNASTSLTTASFGFGFNANADDVVASATHTELTGSTLYTVVEAKVGATRGTATDVFGLKCSVAQGGAATVDVDVFGFFQ